MLRLIAQQLRHGNGARLRIFCDLFINKVVVKLNVGGHSIQNVSEKIEVSKHAVQKFAHKVYGKLEFCKHTERVTYMGNGPENHSTHSKAL